MNCVVYASDDNYAELLGISLISLFEKSLIAEDMSVFVLDSGISLENKKKICVVAQRYNRNVFFIEAVNIEEILSIDVQTDRGSISQFSRLFLGTLLPENVHKVLYLDCDTLINNSIYELFETDMNGKVIMALADAFSNKYNKNVGLNDDIVMFNSGVMLIDLDLWKKNNIEFKMLEFLKNRNGKIQQGDQGVLNAVLAGNVLFFDAKYNCVTYYVDFNYDELMTYRKPNSSWYYSEKQISDAIENPSIIHFTSAFSSIRPWFEFSNHYFKDKWYEYKENSPWRDCALRKKKKNILSNFVLFLYKKMPRNFSVGIAGILQAYIRPFINSL